MIQFNSNNLEDLHEEMNLRNTEISVEIIKGICDALDQNIGSVLVAFAPEVESGLEIFIEKPNFLEALEINLDRCENAEEFELCQRAIKWIEKLQ